MKFKKIIGGSEKDAYKKFPWLRNAKIFDATIDITQDYLIWEDGVWKGGVWEDGFWEGGVWKGGVWKDGFWEDGVWEGGFWEGGFWEDGFWEDGVWEVGFMWSNLRQKYIRTIQKKGKFIEKKAGKS